jgi:hypothetical protein
VNAQTTSYVGSGYVANAYASSVFTPQGVIYAIPWSASEVTKIDTKNSDAITTFGSFVGGLKWQGGVYYKGKIFCIPRSATQVLVIDTLNSDATYFLGGGYGGNAYIGGCVGADGRSLYFTPYAATTVTKLDLETETFSTIGSFAAGQYYGACLSHNGDIYCLKTTAGAHQFLKIDSSDNITFVGGTSLANGYIGLKLSIDGYIYAAPFLSTTFMRINENTDVVTTFGTVAGSETFEGIVDAGNGDLLCVPRLSTTVARISGSSTYEDNNIYLSSLKNIY